MTAALSSAAAVVAARAVVRVEGGRGALEKLVTVAQTGEAGVAVEVATVEIAIPAQKALLSPRFAPG